MSISIVAQPKNGSTRSLLDTIGGLSKENMRALFETGDDRIDEIITALKDDNEDVRLNAQSIIRYLGNRKGMDALLSEYKSDPKKFLVVGAVPVPIHVLDYEILSGCVTRRATLCELTFSDAFALALDNSERSASRANRRNPKKPRCSYGIERSARY